MHRRLGAILALVLLISALATGSVLASGDVHWSYEGEEGPAHWGDLSPDFAACGTGLEQSPIDIPSSAPVNSSGIVINYQPSAVNILNNGHTIQVNYDAGSSIQVDGGTYNLLQFHFHSDSEHTVDSAQMPLEMHLVHQNAQGGLAVVGVFIVEGAENAAFAPVWDNLPASEGGPDTISGVSVDAGALLPADQSFFRYNGSLTTPPCTEGVKWFVMKNPVEMSAAQIAAFRAIYEGNFRPVQPMNAREFIVGSPTELPTTGADLSSQIPAGLIFAGFALIALGLASHALRRRKIA